MSDDSVRHALRQVKLEGREKELFDLAIDDQDFMDRVGPGRLLALVRVVTRSLFKRKHYKSRVPDDVWDAIREVAKEQNRICPKCDGKKLPGRHTCYGCSRSVVEFGDNHETLQWILDNYGRDDENRNEAD